MNLETEQHPGLGSVVSQQDCNSPSFGAVLMKFEIRNFGCVLGTMDHVNGPQGLLILYLVIFHSVGPEACPYFANEGMILNGI